MKIESTNRHQILKLKTVGKQFLPSYLNELISITKVNSLDDRIKTLEESHMIKEEFRATIKDFKASIVIDFNNKDFVCTLIDEMAKAKKGRIYVWTYYSDYCGMLMIDDLHQFNCMFHFDDEHAGLIHFFHSDFSEGLILDFYEEHGRQKLEIEASGVIWPEIISTYPAGAPPVT